MRPAPALAAAGSEVTTASDHRCIAVDARVCSTSRRPGAQEDNVDQQVRPTVRQNAEAVERCTVCRLPRAQVAAAFTTTRYTGKAPRHIRDAYDAWKERNPGHGLQAARATAVFRTRHGHGPSYGQLCSSLGWPRTLRDIIVQRLLVDGWLAEIPAVPWTLRPGDTAAAHGILLQPRAARE
ncbi:hypothetical protein ACIO6T_39180 [Streptomyces sp. NPDC087532]|uniref:hypothetical protein n=1 Tax=Streptomyces sp. NPDC087532 TaxID=3365795 RepID=UPI0037F1AA9D